MLTRRLDTSRRASGFSPAEKDGVGLANDSYPHGLKGTGVFRAPPDPGLSGLVLVHGYPDGTGEWEARAKAV